MKKLNLGSGEYLKPGFVNVDFYSVSKPDVEHDLSKFPYRSPPCGFDHVERPTASSTAQPFAVMKEVHRIAKNGATVMRTRAALQPRVHARRAQGRLRRHLPLLLPEGIPRGYQGVEFDTDAVKLHWFAHPTSNAPCYLRQCSGRRAAWARSSPLSPTSAVPMLTPLVLLGRGSRVEFRMRVKK